MYSNIEQIKDLLEDPNFVNWVNQPNAELDEHWQEWSEKHPERRSDLLLAKRFVKSLHYKNEFMLDEVEQDKMFEQIKAFKQNKDEADRKLIRKINFRKHYSDFQPQLLSSWHLSEAFIGQAMKPLLLSALFAQTIP